MTSGVEWGYANERPVAGRGKGAGKKGEDGGKGGSAKNER